MRENLRRFIAYEGDTLLNALKKINENKKQFLCIISRQDRLLGTLTDGDIRRALINGASVDDELNGKYHTACKSLHISQDITDAIDMFKSESFSFLPIISDDDILENLLTKKQLHSVFMQDIHVDLNYDFISVDEDIIDAEIFKRPWGFYKTTILNEFFQSKVIIVKPGQKLSLQSHNYREEQWIIVHGSGKVQLGESLLDARYGQSFFVPKGCKHRLINTDGKENLIVVEVQVGDYFGEDDISRYEDLYGRV